MKKKRVSIYTISSELGISPGTVSRALSNHPSISAETRAKVKPLAEKYNFKPRFVSSRPVNICMLIQKFEGHPLGFDEYVSLTMEGAAEYCQEENLELSIYSGFPEELNECDIVRELSRRTANGAIVLRATDESLYFKQMDEQKFPYFCLSQLENVANRTLTYDDETMGYMATKHLLSQGHRVIGVVCGSIHLSSVNARYQGYMRALREANVEPRKELMYTPDPITPAYRSIMQFGEEGVDALLARVPAMTAIFATDDKIAYGAMTQLQLKGISIPGQISVIGISDYPSSQYVFPPLTTISVPYKETGYEAARQVHRLCRGMDVYFKDSVMDSLAPKLVVRKSTGPAREADRGK